MYSTVITAYIFCLEILSSVGCGEHVQMQNLRQKMFGQNVFWDFQIPDRPSENVS